MVRQVQRCRTLVILPQGRTLGEGGNEMLTDADMDALEALEAYGY